MRATAFSVLLVLVACGGSVEEPGPEPSEQDAVRVRCEAPLQACPATLAPDGGVEWLSVPTCMPQGRCYVLR